MPAGCLLPPEPPVARERDIGALFIGARYGFRGSVVRHLRREGIRVATRGRGWPEGSIAAEELPQEVARASALLGMGGIGAAEDLTNVKGRDFELVAYGLAPYITSFSSDLARHFEVGAEILCYGNRDELVELVRHCELHPEEAAAVARAGRARCAREHRWLHRYLKCLSVLGVLE
jgi:spore maturation protein CgeB